MMRIVLTALLLSFSVLPAFSEDGPDKKLVVPAVKSLVRLPTVEMKAPPAPAPKPAPQPVTKLTKEMWYVIDADVECFIKPFNASLITVTVDQGPLRLRGHFADVPGKIETRNYAGKFVYILTAAGVGKAELVVVPKGVDKPEGVLLVTLDVNDGSKPPAPPNPPGPTPPGPNPPGPNPPGPNPPGPNPPTPSASPFAADGFRVLILFENKPETQMSLDQREIISGQAVREFLETNCVAGSDGKTKEYRIWRADEDLTNVPKLWKDTAARAHPALPWVCIGNGKTGYEGPLPANKVEFLKLANQYLTK